MRLADQLPIAVLVELQVGDALGKQALVAEALLVGRPLGRPGGRVIRGGKWSEQDRERHDPRALRVVLVSRDFHYPEKPVLGPVG